MSIEEHHHKVAIRIDHKPYEAPKETMTGLELRALADPPISQDYDSLVGASRPRGRHQGRR